MCLFNMSLVLALSSLLARVQADDLANFGDIIPVLGNMERTDQDYTDGLALDLFSPKSRSLVVTNNSSPLPGQFVTGSSGEGWINLSPYSWVVKMNETAQDLVAKIELPYDLDALAKQGVVPANTYVGTLAADKKSWVVLEQQRNVHVSENKTRIIKMKSLDGEYMLLGRKSVDTSNIFVQYGQGATRTVNCTGGPGVQEAEFVDGLRFHIQSSMALKMNIQYSTNVENDALPAGGTPINSYAWVINTTAPEGNDVTARVAFPYNQAQPAGKKEKQEAPRVVVAKRVTRGMTGQKFTVLDSENITQTSGSVVVSGMKDLDGQYILMADTTEDTGRDGQHEGGNHEDKRQIHNSKWR